MRARRPSRALLLGLGALVFFGVGVDMAHVTLHNPTANVLAGVEDGGEMVVASVLTYMVFKHVWAQ